MSPAPKIEAPGDPDAIEPLAPWLAEILSFMDEIAPELWKPGVYGLAKATLTGLEFDSLPRPRIKLNDKGTLNLKWDYTDGNGVCSVTFVNASEFGYRLIGMADDGSEADTGWIRVKRDCTEELRDLMSEFYGREGTRKREMLATCKGMSI